MRSIARSLLGAVLLAALALLPASAQRGNFGADSPVGVVSKIVANNTTPVLISGIGAVVYSVEVFNNSATVAFVKLYNLAAVPSACGTTAGTPQARYMIPGLASGAAAVMPNINGDAYSNGVVMCVTTGIADSDTGSPAATTYIVNIHLNARVL